MPVLARYSGTVKVDGEEEEEESNVWFPATIVRRVEYNKYELQWDDGDDPEHFFARCARTRPRRRAGRQAHPHARGAHTASITSVMSRLGAQSLSPPRYFSSSSHPSRPCPIAASPSPQPTRTRTLHTHSHTRTHPAHP
eukprot:3462766-Prymnesium_polylepis.2